jgi:hypothetical protein
MVIVCCCGKFIADMIWVSKRFWWGRKRGQLCPPTTFAYLAYSRQITWITGNVNNLTLILLN